MTDPLHEVAALYEAMLAEHGPTARGVGWNNSARQWTSFDMLAAMLPAGPQDLVIGDLGCGYGALFDYLALHPAIHAGGYRGWDMAPAMVAAAAARIRDPRARFAVAAAPAEPVDYVFASGTFNLKGELSDHDWAALVRDSLRRMAAAARRGFAVNFLSLRRAVPVPGVYLAEPCQWLEFCLGLSGRVALRHDYGLPEFTLHVHLGPG